MVYSREAMLREHAELVRNPRHVRIVPEKIREVAAVMSRELARAGDAADVNPAQSPLAALGENNLDTIQFYFILTSQEFCIWRRNASGGVEAWEVEIDGHRYVGAPGIAAAHIRAIRRGQPLLDPAYLAAMTLDDVKEFYRDERTGEVTLQMLPQRLAKFNELGRVLLDSYGGHAANVLRRAEGYLFREDERGLIQQLQLNFPIAYFDWPFCKLAFLLANLLNTRRESWLPTTDEYRALTVIHDPENFEIAADYYIPLFFMRVGIFEIDDELARRLTEQRLIERGSLMEQEFRAGTIVAGRMLAEETGFSVNAVDHECWQMGYLRCRLCREGISDEELPCSYRGISAAYQQTHSLMDLRWPLVLTTCY